MKRPGPGVRRYVAMLDAACAWINPSLVVVAIGLALIDLTVAGQRWAAAYPAAPALAATAVAVAAKECSPIPAPELSDLAGRD